MKPNDIDGPLTFEVPEVAKMLGLSRNNIYAAVKRGDLPAIRIGRLLRIPRAALHRMLDQAGAIERGV